MARISGIVTLGSSETPGQATVLVLDSTCENVISETDSDPATGEYEFTGLDSGDYYLMLLGAGVYRSKVFGPCTAQPEAPYLNNYSALLHLDGADNSTAIVDVSGKSWSVSGNAKLDTDQFKFGPSSLLLDGSDDDISSAANADFGFGTGDFTVEMWVRRANSNCCIWDSRSINSDSMTAFVNTDGYICFFDSGATKTGSIIVPANTWSHLAWCRKSGVIKMFVDGAEAFSAAHTTNMGSSRPMRIGRDVNGAADYSGWIDDIRITKGIGLYDGSFTPPAQAFSNGRVISQLHFDGADASTVFTDTSGKTWTAAGNAQIDTTDVKFGSGALLLDGTGDYITTAAHSDFAMFSGDFTVEFFFKAITASGNQCLIQFASSATNRANISLVNNLDFYTEVSGSSGQRIVAAAPSAGVWHHVALVKSGSTITLYLDGVSQGTTTTTALPSGSILVSVGANSFGGTSTFNGRIDDLRITRGAALYTSDFTPPNEPAVDP